MATSAGHGGLASAGGVQAVQHASPMLLYPICPASTFDGLSHAPHTDRRWMRRAGCSTCTAAAHPSFTGTSRYVPTDVEGAAREWVQAGEQPPGTHHTLQNARVLSMCYPAEPAMLCPLSPFPAEPQSAAGRQLARESCRLQPEVHGSSGDPVGCQDIYKQVTTPASWPASLFSLLARLLCCPQQNPGGAACWDTNLYTWRH